MTCLSPIKVKGVNFLSPVRAMVPCGSCYECRQAHKNAWCWRLAADLEFLRGCDWKVGFFTLTYRDSALPYYPIEAFKDPRDYRKIPCFSKSDVREFILRLRKFIWKRYGVVGCRYIVCSEFGSHTKRAHYHGIIAWNPYGKLNSYLKKKGYTEPPELTPKKMHSIIKHLWYKGFIFPRYYDGGLSNGIPQKPFEVVDTTYKAQSYCAKYCCKDLTYVHLLRGVDFNKKSKAFKYGNCFHVQSRGLGSAIIPFLSDDEKINLYVKGIIFNGNERPLPIPIYIRNKLLFDNFYVIEEKSGKRLVRRKASAFFIKHAKEIFRKKCDFVDTLVSTMDKEEFWRSRGIPKYVYRHPISLLKNFKSTYGSLDLSELYLAYYGVPRDRCYEIDSLRQWFGRYRDITFKAPALPIHYISQSLWQDIQNLFATCFSALRWEDKNPKIQKMRLIEETRDFLNSKIGHLYD